MSKELCAGIQRCGIREGLKSQVSPLWVLGHLISSHLSLSISKMKVFAS